VNGIELVFLALLLPLIGLSLWTTLGRGGHGRDPTGQYTFCCSPDAVFRAQELLHDVFSDEETRQLNAFGYLVVKSSLHPGREYHIPRYQGKVKVFEGDKLVAGLCLQPFEPLPDADVIVLHKVMLEGDEAGYLATANRFVPHRNGLWRLEPYS
jgi:hypothetical protein